MVVCQVECAMEEYDKDKSGELDFKEFVNMLVMSDAFKFKLTDEQKQELIAAMKAKDAVVDVETPCVDVEPSLEMQDALSFVQVCCGVCSQVWVVLLTRAS